MRAVSAGKLNIRSQAGISTVEMLIAFLVVILSITAVVGVVFGSQSMRIDTQTNQEAQLKALNILENARAQSIGNYDAVVSDPAPIADDIYQRQLIVDPFQAAECSKELKAKVTWTDEPSRPQSVEIRTRVKDLQAVYDNGGDCSVIPPGGSGGDLTPTGTPINLGGIKTNGLDVLNHTAYVAVQNNVGFITIDTADVNNPLCYGVSLGSCGNYANGYSAGVEAFDIDVAKASDGRIYAYLARKSTALQFEVVDVTAPDKPFTIVKKGLTSITPGAANSEGYRIFYYKDKLYITTRETAGKEFHVFNVATPWDPASITEYANPKELNRTVTDFTVVDQTICNPACLPYTVAYLVAKAGLKEVSAWDVTSPTNMSEIPLSIVNLPGGYDAFSTYFSSVSKFLYVGRQSNGAEELFVYEASNPFTGLVEKGKTNVGQSIIGIKVAGPYAYMTSDSSNKDLIVFNADPSSLSQILISDDNNSNKGTGIDYEDHIIYESFEQGSKSIRLFYAP